MNTLRTHWYIISICVLGGILFYAVHQEWLFFFCTHRFSSKFCDLTTNNGTCAEKSTASAARKKAALIFWRHDRWAKETVELVWPTDTAQALTYLLNNWCTLLDEEHITEQKITVQSVLLANNGTQALISFDRTPFAKESSNVRQMATTEKVYSKLFAKMALLLPTLSFWFAINPCAIIILILSTPGL